MTGYKRAALRLEWPEDSEFAGLVVRMKRISIKQLLRVERLGNLRSSGTAEEVESAMTEILDTIGKGLLGWNYETERVVSAEGAMVETESVPVPAVRESLDDLDIDMVMAIVKAWTKAAAGVPLASPPNSPSGGTAEPPDELGNWLAWEQQQNPTSLPEPVSS